MSVVSFYRALRDARRANGAREHRRAPRTRCLLKARCVYNKGCSSLDVLMRDISKSGARICGEGIRFLPNTFELLIQRGGGEDERRFVRRVWTNGDLAGVAFIAYRPELWK
jgi:hypothetical protein